MNFENNPKNEQEKIIEMSDLAKDVKQSIFDLIQFKNYGGLSADQINFQLDLINQKIETLLEAKNPNAEELKSLVSGNFSSYSNGRVE